jgi:hypothetical protein
LSRYAPFTGDDEIVTPVAVRVVNVRFVLSYTGWGEFIMIKFSGGKIFIITVDILLRMELDCP